MQASGSSAYHRGPTPWLWCAPARLHKHSSTAVRKGGILAPHCTRRLSLLSFHTPQTMHPDESIGTPVGNHATGPCSRYQTTCPDAAAKRLRAGRPRTPLRHSAASHGDGKVLGRSRAGGGISPRPASALPRAAAWDPAASSCQRRPPHPRSISPPCRVPFRGTAQEYGLFLAVHGTHHTVHSNPDIEASYEELLVGMISEYQTLSIPALDSGNVG